MVVAIGVITVVFLSRLDHRFDLRFGCKTDAESN
jgi:hypothetical protein